MFSSDGYLYNDKNTVESKYTIKRYNIVNKKLRKSKSKIIPNKINVGPEFQAIIP